MIKVVIWILFLIFTAYVMFCALLYIKQRSLLYYPTPRTSPANAAVMVLENEGHSLKVLSAQPERKKAVIYFGGNAENIAFTVPELQRIFPEHALYVPHYRGYGGSSGQATEEALYSDGLALLQSVSLKYDSVVVMGRSLGSAVAVYLASRKPVGSLVLVTPFDSMTELASTFYPFVPVSLLLKDKFNSVSRAAAIQIPTLVLIAERDEVIPRKNSERLAAAFDPGLATIFVVPGAGHNDIETNPLYGGTIKTFVSSHQKISGGTL